MVFVYTGKILLQTLRRDVERATQIAKKIDTSIDFVQSHSPLPTHPIRCNAVLVLVAYNHH